MAIFSNSGGDQESVITITLDSSGATKSANVLQKELDGLDNTANRSTGGFSKLQAQLVTLDSALGLASKGFSILKGAASTLDNALTEGLRVQNLEQGFRSLSASVGQDSVASFDSLKAATRGLVDNMSLLQSANQAILLGVDDGSGKFQQLAGDAIKLGQAMGIDAKQAIDSLVIGIGRQSKLVLDNLGVIVSAEDAYKRYADTLGKTTEQLTDQEKKLAFNEAAFAAVSEKANTLAEANESAGFAYQRLSASASDATTEFYKGFASSTDLARSFNDLDSDMDGLDFEGLGRDVADFVAQINYLRNSILSILPSFEFLGKVTRGYGVLIAGVKRAFDAGKSFKEGIEEAANETRNLESGLKKIDEQVKNINSSFSNDDNVGRLKESVKILEEEIRNLTQASVNASASDSILNLKRIRELQGSIQIAQGRIVQLTKSTGGGGGEDSLDKAAKKAAKAFESLEEQLAKVEDNKAIKGLRDELTKAFKSGNFAAAQELEEELSVTIQQGVIRGFERASGGEATQAARELAEKFGDIQAEEISSGIEKGLEGKKSFFQKGLDNLGLGFDVGSVFGGNLALQVENGLADALKSALEGGSVEGALKNLGSGLATAIGSATGAGPLGGAVFESIFSSTLSGIGNAAKGRKLSGLEQAALALPTFGLSFAVNPILSLFGGRDAEESARKGIVNTIEDALKESQALIRDAEGKFVPLTNIVLGDPDRFTGNSEFNQLIESAPAQITNAFIGVGNVIAQTLGEGFEQGGQVGAAIFDQFEGDVDSLKVVVQSLGLTFEQAQKAMVNAFLAGDASALEVVSRLRDMEEAFKPGLAGFAQYEKAFENFIASAGEGRVSIKSLTDLAIEFKETGSASFSAFQESLAGSSKFTQEQVQQLFDGLRSQGIDSLDKLESASDLALINVIANLQSAGFQFSDTFSEGVRESADSVKELNDLINNLPNTTEKSLKINVTSQYDSDASRDALNLISRNSPGIARP